MKLSRCANRLAEWRALGEAWTNGKEVTGQSITTAQTEPPRSRARCAWQEGQPDATEFGHTTLANLSPSLPGDAVYLWVHVFLAFIMFPVAILLMRKFSMGLKMTDTDLKITR